MRAYCEPTVVARTLACIMRGRVEETLEATQSEDLHCFKFRQGTVILKQFLPGKKNLAANAP